MSIEFTAFARTTEGRGASRRMRRAGKAPGIVYGGAAAPEPIELDHNALFHALRNEAFQASILTMKLNGSSTQVLLRSVQMHPFKNEILHVDFQRVDENRKIHMKVPLHFINAEISPGVKTGGGTVNHVLAELDISCLPDDLPEFIEVDLQNLQMGHSMHLSELTLPKGVQSVQLRSGDDAVVVTIVVPRAEVEPEAEAAPVEGAVPGAVAPSAVPASEQKAPEPEKKEADKSENKRDRGDRR